MPITALYASLLALIFLALSVRVIGFRRVVRIGLGDGGDTALLRRVRVHANFAEYVPLIVLMIALLEMSGLPAWRVHLLMGALLAARLLHPLGMYVGPRTLRFQICRVGGIVLTQLVLIGAALLLLGRFLPAVF